MDTFSKTFRNITYSIYEEGSKFKNNLKYYLLNHKSSRGFTLIELIVVVTIIAVLFTAIGAIFNPFAQIQKAKNATRQQDITQIRNALDSYFNDKGCYPTSLTFGSKWSAGTTVYMEKVPQDPDCNGASGSCFVYEIDTTSSCPQWNVLYAQMRQPVVSTIATCALNNASNCAPQGGFYGYNYCAVSGKLDCNYIAQNPIPGNNATSTQSPPQGTPTGGPTPTPVNCNATVSTCSIGQCDAVQAQGRCMGCGGSSLCWSDLKCGGNSCK